MVIPVREMGVRIQDQVKLDNVLEAKARGIYLRNCLKKAGQEVHFGPAIHGLETKV